MTQEDPNKTLDVITVREAGVLVPNSNGDNPKASEILIKYPEIEPSHPPVSMLSAEHSPFEYWIYAPKKRENIGSTHRHGIPARVEKVKHDGKILKLIGYGDNANEIDGWYYYEDFRKYFKTYYEPKQELLRFANSLIFNKEPEVRNWNPYVDPDRPNLARPYQPYQQQLSHQDSQPTRGSRGSYSGSFRCRRYGRGYTNY